MFFDVILFMCILIVQYLHLMLINVDLNELELELRLPSRLSCASHTLNLIATTDFMTGLRDFEILNDYHNEIVNCCSVLWKTTRSFKNNEIIKSVLKASLNIPVKTRWNSFYNCLKQIFKFKIKSLI